MIMTTVTITGTGTITRTENGKRGSRNAERETARQMPEV
jgi:hypothetical protein